MSNERIHLEVTSDRVSDILIICEKQQGNVCFQQKASIIQVTLWVIASDPKITLQLANLQITDGQANKFSYINNKVCQGSVKVLTSILTTEETSLVSACTFSFLGLFSFVLRQKLTSIQLLVDLLLSRKPRLASNSQKSLPSTSQRMGLQVCATTLDSFSMSLLYKNTCALDFSFEQIISDKFP